MSKAHIIDWGPSCEAFTVTAQFMRDCTAVKFSLEISFTSVSLAVLVFIFIYIYTYICSCLAIYFVFGMWPPKFMGESAAAACGKFNCATTLCGGVRHMPQIKRAALPVLEAIIIAFCY